jgi:hypothetical protein
LSPRDRRANPSHTTVIAARDSGDLSEMDRAPASKRSARPAKCAPTQRESIAM